MDLNAAPFEFAVYRQGATAPGSRSPELKAFATRHFEERMRREILASAVYLTSRASLCRSVRGLRDSAAQREFPSAGMSCR